ncbi:MAG: protein archease [Gammaproteobacteria bacterium]|nr:MAG: protein archease [Gammaproteobacteria bacterium]
MPDQPGHRFLEDVAIADVAFQAWAPDLAGLCREAALALLEVMIEDPLAVHPRVERRIRLERDSAEWLLYDFLEELVFIKDTERLLLRPVALTAEEGAPFRLDARMMGEAVDPRRHPVNADVKAVTLHRYRCERRPEGWFAEVVLDI